MRQDQSMRVRAKGDWREMRFKAASRAMLTLLTISVFSMFSILALRARATNGDSEGVLRHL